MPEYLTLEHLRPTIYLIWWRLKRRNFSIDTLTPIMAILQIFCLLINVVSSLFWAEIRSYLAIYRVHIWYIQFVEKFKAKLALHYVQQECYEYIYFSVTCWSNFRHILCLNFYTVVRIKLMNIEDHYVHNSDKFNYIYDFNFVLN